jgi:hypothetical protein
MFHFQPRDQRVRFYVSGGVGAKFYNTTGLAPVPQPLPRIAALTNQSQWKPAFDVGGGVRIRVQKHLTVRGDFRDYITAFPNMLFVPAGNGTERGIFHQFTPMFGVGANF